MGVYIDSIFTIFLAYLELISKLILMFTFSKQPLNLGTE